MSFFICLSSLFMLFSASFYRCEAASKLQLHYSLTTVSFPLTAKTQGVKVV
jgi:hypothetical protein